MASMQLWSVEPPAQWRAGFVGTDRVPLFFSCADCGEKDAKIAGIISTDGTFHGVGVLRTDGSAFLKPALFCVPCYRKRLDAITKSTQVDPS